MKKYGCSNIDELVDELKRLRIENKELQEEIENKTDRIKELLSLIADISKGLTKLGKTVEEIKKL